MKAICISILVFFGIHEFKQARQMSNLKEYFSGMWNWTDILLILAYFTLAVLDHLADFYIATTILQVFVVSLAFIKICFFLRIYEGFGFLVSLMSGVFKDIKYFFALWVLFIFWFGVIFTILYKKEWSDTYDALGYFDYFMLTYRLSLGDLEFGNFTVQKSQLIAFSIMLWIIGVFILNVMFMNFIIAVISESYEKVM